MTPSQCLRPMLNNFRRMILLLAIGCALALLFVSPALAQTYSVIHAFTGGGDGRYPQADLTLDGGILYGTTSEGGGIIGRLCDPTHHGCGVVFQMKEHSGGWVLTPLYPFTGYTDGQGPQAPVIFGSNGLLYGSTTTGGNVGVQDCIYGGCGVVFTMHPQATTCHTALRVGVTRLRFT